MISERLPSSRNCSRIRKDRIDSQDRLGRVLESTVSWTTRIDGFIEFLKWPSAVIAACLIPLVAWALVLLAVRCAANPWPLIPFFAGLFVFAMIWRNWLAQRGLGRFLITLEHESTHALFAILTWHRIVSFRVSFGKGGRVRFRGRGNWLITASPYFFPTAALIFFLLAYFLPFPGLPWQAFLLGAALSYHVISTLQETSVGQSDLKELGFMFCLLFLPAANLAVIGLLVSFAHDGTQGIALWFSDMMGPLQRLGDWWQDLPWSSLDFKGVKNEYPELTG